jgi:hypothetical protein
MVVHFPDLALRFTDETLVDRAGAHWSMSTQPSFDNKQRVYVLRTSLTSGATRFEGWFRIAEALVQELEADGDLRVFALREVRKCLDKGAVAPDFQIDLPFAG